ncbi:MAG: chemotaxis protein CheA [Oscillospiraceae bacterium]
MSTDDFGMEALLGVFIHETDEMLEQLDEILLDSERAKSITDENINSIFRITHTIKGSAAMMSFNKISSLAHTVEDIFYILRENPSKLSLVFDSIFDLVFQASDFFKREMENLQGDNFVESDPSDLIAKLSEQAAIIKGEKQPDEPIGDKPVVAEPVASVPVNDTPPINDEIEVPQSEDENEESTLSGPGLMRIHVFFETDCGMENLRAFMLMSQLEGCCSEMTSIPPHPENDSACAADIVKDGFKVICRPSGTHEAVIKTIESSLSIMSYEVLEDDNSFEEESAAVAVPNDSAAPAAPVSDTSAAPAGTNAPEAAAEAAPAVQQAAPAVKPPEAAAVAQAFTKGVKQSLISVNQSKLDHLMDLVGEIVTAESMVARNPDLKGLRLDNFTKSLRELRKLTDELQDIVMSIRMVPLQGTFQKMDRIVRDMGKKLGKKAELVTEGGDTEVDKTINDAIVDPFMHMIRNSMDHAIEEPDVRRALGKPEVGRIGLSAKNTGGEILITISDDGAGLDTEKLLAKAKRSGILTRPESSYTEKEIFGLILLPGFSTNTNVTEFSGRGVGMDVVRKNLEQVGGTISISSEKNKGTIFTIKIPLTLAIVDGMNIAVGKTVFTLPITAIRQSFRITDDEQIIHNTDGTEMILLRGECYPIIRLKDLFAIDNGVQNIMDGIMIQVDCNNAGYCIFADELLGEYQVVVKPFPIFLNKYDLKNQGLSGCSVLGDGSISLILDVNTLKND